MNTNVERLRMDEALRTAAQRMRDCDIGFLPVVNEMGLVVGTITDRDIVVRAVADGQVESKIADHMTREVISCFANDEVARCEELMALYQKSRIVILDDQGMLAGVVSIADIARSRRRREVGETIRDVKSETPPSR